jgi:hypothetical protein
MVTENIEERLVKLEHTTRRYRIVLTSLGLVIVACAAVCLGLGSVGRALAQKTGEASRTIRANEFVLEDENGHTRAMLRMTASGPMLALYDEGFNPHIVLQAAKGGSALILMDENGKPRISLNANVTAGPGLALRDGDGVYRVIVANTVESGPGITLYNRKASRIWGAP